MLTVTPNPLVQGQKAKVCISGSSHADGPVVVNIDDGEGNTDTLTIQLVEGAGCADWPVPDWEQARFNYGLCAEEARNIVLPVGG